jgi:hypothetical protein
MSYLGIFKSGVSVFYSFNFYDAEGPADPVAVAAQLRTPGGAWVDLPAPVKQNGKTGYYGGEINTEELAGQYAVHIEGVFATGDKAEGDHAFNVDAVVASVDNYVAPDNAGITKLNDMADGEEKMELLEGKLYLCVYRKGTGARISKRRVFTNNNRDLPLPPPGEYHGTGANEV